MMGSTVNGFDLLVFLAGFGLILTNYLHERG